MAVRSRRGALIGTGAAAGLVLAGPLAGVAAAAGIIFSTYLGGTDDEAAVYFSGRVAIAVDDLGNRYVTGATRSTDFPTTPGAKRSLSGDMDVFVTKIAPGGTILYSTYLGGPCDDVAVDIAVDARGNAYVTGRVHGGVCLAEVAPSALVAKLDPAGSLVWAAGLGGSLADTSIGQAIAVDAQGQAYVAGTTTTSSHDFPATPGAFRTGDCSGGWSAGGDGFVAKLGADGASLEYATFLCGSAHDSPNGIAVDAAGSAYVVGSTESRDFPTRAAIQDAHRGGPVAVTGFVSKLLPDGSGLAWSTYLGGSTNDLVGDVALDAHGSVYLTGETQSDDFPTTAGVVQPRPDNRLCFHTVCSDAFVTKLDPTGAAVAWSTLLYGEGNDAGASIAVDVLGNAYVVGTTSSRFFPIAGAFQPAGGGPSDAFVAKLDAAGARLLYSSYLGGARTGASPLIGADGGSAIAVDRIGNAHVAGYTLAFDFPTTAHATQPSLGDGICDVAGTPCGDAFVVSVWADGPRTVPAIDLGVTPSHVAPGGTFTARWTGLAPPTPRDELRLYTLGAYGGSFDEAAAWSTGGWAAGEAVLTAPHELEAGWYELRLLSPDSGSDLLAVVARSEPIHLDAGAPVAPPVPTCETGCSDGDPCTADTCVGTGLCTSTSVSGVASVTCTCERRPPGACTGQRVPRSVDARRGRLCRTLAATASRGATARRRVRSDAAALARALPVVARARRTGRISRDCATALRAELRDAKDRALRLLRGFARGRGRQPRAAGDPAPRRGPSGGRTRTVSCPAPPRRGKHLSGPRLR